MRSTAALSQHAARRSGIQAEDAGTHAIRRGISLRQVSIPLPAITPNGVTKIGLFVAEGKATITAVRVAYLTAPTSAGGTVVLDVKKVSGGTTTLAQDTAGFDLKGLAAAVPSQVASLALALATRILQANDYVYAEITSDNADAVDGTGGVLVVTYTAC